MNARCLRLAARGWHRWFAWRPVVIGIRHHWLEYVERRHVCGSEICYWAYRSLP